MRTSAQNKICFILLFMVGLLIINSSLCCSNIALGNENDIKITLGLSEGPSLEINKVFIGNINIIDNDYYLLSSYLANYFAKQNKSDIVNFTTKKITDDGVSQDYISLKDIEVYFKSKSSVVDHTKLVGHAKNLLFQYKPQFKEYQKRHNDGGSRYVQGPIVGAVGVDGDKVTLQVYDVVETDPEEVHTATRGWFTVDAVKNIIYNGDHKVIYNDKLKDIATIDDETAVNNIVSLLQIENFKGYLVTYEGLDNNNNYIVKVSLSGRKLSGTIAFRVNSRNGSVLFTDHNKEMKSDNVYAILAAEYADRNEVEKAYEYCSKALNINGNNAFAHYLNGMIDMNSTKSNTMNYVAILSLKKAVSIDPKEAKYNVALGDAYTGIKDYKNAITCYTKAISINTKNPDVYYARSRAFYFSKQIAKAKTDLKTSCNLGLQEACNDFRRLR